MLAETMCVMLLAASWSAGTVFSLLSNYEAIKCISSSFTQPLLSASAIDKGKETSVNGQLHYTAD